MNTDKNIFKGFTLVICAAILWGVSGIVAQFLFEKSSIVPGWLVSVRMLLSGVFLILFGLKKDKNSIFAIWSNGYDIVHLITFSILGMTALQYTYFKAIQEGNAATATILQFLAPVIITCFLSIYKRKLPKFLEILAVLLALIGCFLLVTQGNFNSLSISFQALFWGILSAFALAFYTLNPKRLLLKYGTIPVVGWAMLIGGFLFNFIHPIWKFNGKLDTLNIISILFISFFGTILTYIFYLQSLNYIEPTKASLLTSIEPLTASILVIIFFNVRFGISEWIGTILVLSTVFLLAFAKETTAEDSSISEDIS